MVAYPVANQPDGVRITMAGKPMFGGKKAAPFKKGGGRVSKANLAGAKSAKAGRMLAMAQAAKASRGGK